MKIIDPDGRLAAIPVADSKAVLIARPGQPQAAQAVPGTQVIILGDVAEDLKDWLEKQQIADIAKALGISRSAAGRLVRKLAPKYK